MIKPLFLRLDEVIEVHTDQITRYGGRVGIRDVELLKSAVAMPAARLDKCFAMLESDPLKSTNVKSLKGMVDKYRYRIGNLRVIYEVDYTKNTVYILAILPRGQAYR